MTAWLTDPQRFRREVRHSNRIVPCRIGRPSSLTDVLSQAVARAPDGDALVAGKVRLSWAALERLVEWMSAGLVERGVERGDRVVFFMENRIEFVMALFATARLGAIAVPVGTREQAPGLAHIVGDAGARLILHDLSLTDRLPTEVAHWSLPEAVEETLEAAALAGFAAGPALEDVGEDDPLLIMYTSGTTGTPKGAVVSHGNLVHAGMAYVDCMKLTAADRSVVVVPLSHITGLSALVAAAAIAGGALIVLRHFAVDTFVATAVAERMTHTVLVPAMYNLLLARTDLRTHALKAWRVGGFGGAPMPVTTIDRLRTALPGLGLMNCYGSTETVVAAAILPPEDLAMHSDAVGFAVPGATILVMDDQGRERPPGEPGELWIGGPTVVRGYWQAPEADAANFMGGYWRSGDLGSIDAVGLVRVHDRIKDMINRGGYKIYSAEVENVLMGHPAIAEVAIIGRPCPVLGERVHAVASLRPEFAGADIAGSLASFARDHLADYKRPETFLFLTEPLPRNANGKVMKRELKTLLELPEALSDET
ncbi:class I adenylate-forming enzyme family protein [soil metagenome]